MKIENAPALQIDKRLYSENHPIPPHVIRERRIVWNLLKHLEAHTVVPIYVYDGEERTPTRSHPMNTVSQQRNYVEFYAKIADDKPEDWPTLDEWPQADTTDLEKAYQYQSTIDADFEL